MSAEWLIHPRQPDLTRAYDPISGWLKLVLVERHNSPDTWTLTGPPDRLSAFVPGGGCILDRGGVQITSGRITNIARTATVVRQRVQETSTITFASDLLPIGQRIVFPTPTFNLTSTIGHFPAAYDLRSGNVEALILGYIRSHAGDLASVDRRVSRLRVPASLGRGGTTQVSARLDNLGVLMATLAEAGGLRLRVEHVEEADGPWLDLVITTVSDLSDDVRFGTAGTASTGIINEWSYEIGMPTTTRAIVAGGGELAARDFLEIDDLAAESLWNVAVETLIDQRHVQPDSPDKQTELTRAANEALTEGSGSVKVAFSPMLGPDLEYRRDVRVGDIVGYDLPGLDPAEEKIREATTVVSVENGQPTEQVSVIVGTPDAPTTLNQRQTARALRGVTLIQRSQ